MRVIAVCLTLLLTATPGMSQEALGLVTPQAVTDSGLLKHILPRFSLKTGVRVIADPDGAMELTTGGAGDPVFRDGETVYSLVIGEDPRQKRFRDWMLSEIGKRTIEGFAPDGAAPFSTDFGVRATVTAPQLDGDAAQGARLALVHCGRCHVIGPQNRMSGLGSTPSFAVLRALPDWITRFEEFFIRKPHGAFTQIAGITPPFDPERPSPIVPVKMQIEDLEAIMAFVSQTQAADLGAPLRFQ